jgi:hypothetical protein
VLERPAADRLLDLVDHLEKPPDITPIAEIVRTPVPQAMAMAIRNREFATSECLAAIKRTWAVGERLLKGHAVLRLTLTPIRPVLSAACRGTPG